MWGVWQGRFLTGREKLASLGFPVTPAISRSLHVRELPLKDTKRCSMVAGNCMHLTTVGLIQLVALASFHLTDL